MKKGVSCLLKVPYGHGRRLQLHKILLTILSNEVGRADGTKFLKICLEPRASRK
jgi:hypothetical protein